MFYPIYLLLSVLVCLRRVSLNEFPYEEIEKWTNHFGQHLWKLNQAVTFAQEIKNKYASAPLEEIDGIELVKEMEKDLENFMQSKLQAVQRIAETVEQAVKGHQYDQFLKYSYPKAKYLNDTVWPLEENENFNNFSVNTEWSTVHVATNVFDESPVILNGIKASSVLDEVFVSNYKHDPTLYWQYFGSSKGYLRFYPGGMWPKPFSEEDIDPPPADTYDCRSRPWYIEASMSPKDIIILLDISGSMYGLKFAIAKYVVENILDTLTFNDYVAVFKFSNEIHNVVPCFNRSLVPAFGENIELIKEGLESIKMENKSDFGYGLSFAFELLQQYNYSGQGSQCNQAIMIIADGAAETHEDVFQKYDPDHRVRVFSYLIGREVTEFEEMQWMACTQRGYYTHVTGMSQVPDQVEKYIPVMARPMAFQQVHNFVWTPLYADVTDHREMYVADAMERCELLTTVAIPVYNQSIVEVTELVLLDGNWTEETVEMVRDDLLGVAAVDVPTKQLLRLLPSYKMGVNAYPFITTNHGHLLIHPNLEPFYRGLLKIGYNSVDLTDVEFGIEDVEPWEHDYKIMQLRNDMIDRRTDFISIDVKFNYDNKTRPITRVNTYYYTPIDKTPFTLGVSFPEPYGKLRIRIGTLYLDEIPFSIEDNNWSIHPDWVYCEYQDTDIDNSTPEDLLIHFLTHIRKNVQEFFENKTPRVRSPLGSSESKPEEGATKLYYCDKELIKNLVFDGSATAPFTNENVQSNKDLQIARQMGVAKIFVATHSGLTRWINLEENNTMNSHIHKRAIDELWYKRAVNYYVFDKHAFVFSVPANADVKNDTYITVSHAIFATHNDKSAPAAVIGLQFRHSLFTELIFNSTHGFDCDTQQCVKPCSNEDFNCYLLDENGFILVTEYYKHTGDFFGQVEGPLMRLMVDEGIYEEVNMYDHQATCAEEPKKSAASFITKPFECVKLSALWAFKKLAMLWIEYNLYSVWDINWISTWAFEEEEEQETIKGTVDYEQMQPCSKQMTLYQLSKSALEAKPISLTTNCTAGCDKNLLLQRIPYTNMIMAVTNSDCMCEDFTFDDTIPQAVELGNMTDCDLLKLDFYNINPDLKCYNHHPNETKIRDCGSGCNLQVMKSVIFFCIFHLLGLHMYHSL